MTTTVRPEPSGGEPAAAPAFYVTGGTLGADAASYVERRADRDLLGGLANGDYCYVLNSRQMGKSSLCVRTMTRLKELGWRTCFLDLTKFGGRNLSAEQWYAALLSEAGRELGLRSEMLAFWKQNTELGPMQRFFGAIQTVALPADASPLAVFVDEIDVTRGLPFSADEFFAGVRQCYVGRATDPALDRLTICLLGTATPADLIQDTRTSPFNIGKRVEVRDFTPDEAQPLAQGLGASGAALLGRVLYWTGGQPYLTQRLCRAAQESGAKTPGDIDKLCSDLFLTRTASEADDNLAFVRNRLLKSEVDMAGLLDLYGQMRRGRRVPDDEADPLCAVLKLSGVARTDNGALKVRNRIYDHVFSREWIIEHTPGAELRRQREAYRRGLVRAGAVAACVLLVVALLAASAVQNARFARAQAAIARTAAADADRQKQVAQAQTQIAQAQTQYARQQAGVAAQQSRAAQFAQGKTKAALLSATQSALLSSQRAAALAVANRLKQSALTDATRERQIALNSLSEATAQTLKAQVAGNKEHVEKARAERNLLTANRTLYMSDMNLVQQEWDGGNAGHVVDLLQETKNSPDRGFEWGYWNRVCHLNLITLTGHTDHVTFASFSPDGSRIVTASWDHTAKVWDARTGQETLTLKGHASYVTSAAFSPDGRRIVTASQDGTTRMWDALTGRELLVIDGRSSVTCASFSPDGTRIVTSNGDSLTSNGGSVDSLVRVWDALTGRLLLTLTGHTGAVFPTAFSPDGTRIVTGSQDGTTKVWDARTGYETLTITGPTGAVNSAAFSSDGTRIVTASQDGATRVWDARTGRELLTLKGHAGPVASAAFSPDGARIVTASWDHTARVWDAQMDHETLVLDEHAGIANCAFSPDGTHVVTASWDHTARVWDALTGRLLLTLMGHTGFVSSSSFSPDGTRIVTASWDHTARVWDAQMDHETLVLDEHAGIANCAFSPDGTHVVTASWDHTARVWDALTGRLLLTITGPTGALNSAAFSPDGTRIVTSSGASVTNSGVSHVRVWDVRTGRELLALKGHREAVRSAAFSPDGKRIVTGSWDYTARVWDARTGHELLTLNGRAGIANCAFSPDGTRIITASYDNTATIWDARTGREMLALKGHTGYLNSASFSPDGSRIVTASQDGTTRVWDAQAGRELLTLKGHAGPVASAAFSPDGTRIVTASNDGTARVWDTDFKNQP